VDNQERIIDEFSCDSSDNHIVQSKYWHQKV
jgi:hypothetical protein